MMKAGKDTGSLINHLYSRTNDAEAKVGMGATLLSWTDRHAATVVHVSGDIVGVKRDNAKVVSGSAHDGSAVYEFSHNQEASTELFRRGKDGKYHGVYLNKETGRYKKNGNNILIGRREEYRDPGF